MADFTSSLSKLLGEKIKKQRLALGLSQEEVSKHIGLGRASISNIEVGRHQIPISILYQLAKVLKTEIHFLLPTYDEIEKNMIIQNDDYHYILQNIQITEEARLSIFNVVNNL